MAKIPNYAAHVSGGEIVSIICRGGCPGRTFARLSPADEAITSLQKSEGEQYAGYVAHCLKCGYRATDNYNWSKQ
jgi:predicted metal-binding protein